MVLDVKQMIVYSPQAGNSRFPLIAVFVRRYGYHLCHLLAQWVLHSQHGTVTVGTLNSPLVVEGL